MGYQGETGWGDYFLAGLTALHPAIGAAYIGLDNSQAGDALKALKNAMSTEEIQGILQQSPARSTSNVDKLYSAAEERKKLLDAAQAAPVVDMLTKMSAEGNTYDPNFSGAEWIKGMATTPALGGNLTSQQYDALRGPQGINGNQLVPQLLQGAETQAQKMGNLYRAAENVGTDKFDPGTITEFLSPTGLGALTTGEKGTGGASLADKLIALKKQSEEGHNSANLQKFLNAVGAGNLADSPALNAIYAAAPRGVKPADIETITKNTNITPTVTYHDIGGPNNTVQLAGFDSRGNQVGTFGVPTDKRNNISMSSKFEESGVKDFLGQIPKYMEAAQTAKSGINTIGKMVQLLDSGAAGAQGYALATIAPALDLMGVRTKGMTDAQLYQALSKSLGGSMRQQIVGPGPVSNYEQGLLQSVSAGGTTGAAAAKELLNYYYDQALTKVKTYNSMVDAASKLAPKTAGAWKGIDLGGDYLQQYRASAAAELERRRAAKGGK